MTDFGIIDIVSSDDESPIRPQSPKPVPKSNKRAALTTLPQTNGKRAKLDLEDSIILLSDDEDNIIKKSKDCIKSNEVEVNNGENVENDPDIAEVVNSDDDDENDSLNASTSSENKTKDVVIGKELQEFIDLCVESISNVSTKELFLTKVLLLKNIYSKATNYVQSSAFLETIKNNISTLKENPTKAINLFSSIVVTIKSNKDDEHHSNKLRKLEKMFNILTRKIRKIETTDVVMDDSDDENSSYIMLDVYKKRAVDVHKKISKIIGQDCHYGIPYYSRLDFFESKYREINSVINKKYHNREDRPFPIYDDMYKIIKKCVKQHNIELSQAAFDLEVAHCFVKLGDILQKRRKQDLANIHLGYLTSVMEDPAKDDEELERKLREHRKTAFRDLEHVEQKYISMQCNGTNPDLNVDSQEENISDDDSDKE